MRGNKPVGRAARILIALSIATILVAVVIGIVAMRSRQDYPARGAAALPGQAAGAGAVPGGRPVAP